MFIAFVTVWPYIQDVSAIELTGADALFEIGGSARSIALGLASGIADEDASSLFTNPASLSRVVHLSASTTYRHRMGNKWESASGNMDASYNAFAMAYRLGKGIGVLGLGVVSMGIDDIPETVFDSDVPTGRVFSDRKFGVVMAHSKNVVGDDLWLGFSTRLLWCTLHDATGSGYGLELGGVYRITRTWSSSLVLGKGAVIEWEDYTERSPMYLKLGIGGRLLKLGDHSLSLFMESVQKRGLPLVFGLGLEQVVIFGKDTKYAEEVFFRAGLGNLYIEDRGYGVDTENRNGDWSVGFGLRKKKLFKSLDLEFNYAYRSKEIWDENFFSVGITSR